MDPHKIANILKITAIVIFALAALALVPSPGASKACKLGYKAKCSFTPISTLILIVVGVALFIARRWILG